MGQATRFSPKTPRLPRTGKATRRPSVPRALPVLLCGLVVWGIAAGGSLAAELRLKPQCMPGGSLVRLGDVAEIVATDSHQAAALATIELFPAPAAREQRFLGVRELQDLLVLRGVNLTEHRFSGCSQVAITGTSQSAPVSVSTPTASGTAPISIAISRRACRRACDAVVKYLREHVSPDRAWTVDAELTDAQARLLIDATRPISIAGGRDPWVGSQRFEVTVSSAQGPARFTLEAKVHVPMPVVTATRALGRGVVVREGDVELQNESSADASVGVHTIEEVIGRELTRAVAEGKVVTASDLRSPPVVHRGDMVTVYANSAGIRIRTTARAKDDGCQGELVAIESILDHSSYYARVSGIREVEVFARSPRVGPTESAANDVIRR